MQGGRRGTDWLFRRDPSYISSRGYCLAKEIKKTAFISRHTIWQGIASAHGLSSGMMRMFRIGVGDLVHRAVQERGGNEKGHRMCPEAGALPAALPVRWEIEEKGGGLLRPRGETRK